VKCKDAEGQYVIGDDGEKVRGVWVPDAEQDEPRIVFTPPS
jgi:hypothetical protein